MTSALVVRCSVLDVQPVRAIERSKVILEGIKPIGDSLAFPSVLGRQTNENASLSADYISINYFPLFGYSGDMSNYSMSIYSH